MCCVCMCFRSFGFSLHLVNTTNQIVGCEPENSQCRTDTSKANTNAECLWWARALMQGFVLRHRLHPRVFETCQVPNKHDLTQIIMEALSQFGVC